MWECWIHIILGDTGGWLGAKATIYQAQTVQGNPAAASVTRDMINTRFLDVMVNTLFLFTVCLPWTNNFFVFSFLCLNWCVIKTYD